MHHKTTVSVSVVVPNYNNGRYLNEFIISVVNSTVLPLELIIIDDGSTDDSLQILERFQYLDFLVVIKLSSHQGLPAALNAGLERATGDFIMRADPDDILHLQRIEKQWHYMNTHPEAEVLGCNVWYFNHEDQGNINVSNFPVSHEGIVKLYRRGINGIQHPTAFMRSSVALNYRYEKMFPGEDYEIFSRMARDGVKFANISEPLYRMRVHRWSSTSNLTYAALCETFEIRDRIWGTHSSAILKWRYFIYIYFYRKYQLSTHLLKHLYLLPAVICFPSRLIKRLI